MGRADVKAVAGDGVANRLWLMLYTVISAVTLVLFAAALIDIITRQEGQVRHLPKFGWIIIVILLPVVGSIVWFAVGREYGTTSALGSFGDPRRHEVVAAAQETRSRSTEEELAQLEREIAFHEKQARIQRLEAEVQKRRLSE